MLVVRPSQSAVHRKRGNPNWGDPFRPIPALATEFEQQAHALGLTSKSYAASTQLRRWCERNKNRCYVPEWLLAEWGIVIDLNTSGSWS